jgi:hypothetical protein
MGAAKAPAWVQAGNPTRRATYLVRTTLPKNAKVLRSCAREMAVGMRNPGSVAHALDPTTEPRIGGGDAQYLGLIKTHIAGITNTEATLG